MSPGIGRLPVVAALVVAVEAVAAVDVDEDAGSGGSAMMVSSMPPNRIDSFRKSLTEIIWPDRAPGSSTASAGCSACSLTMPLLTMPSKAGKSVALRWSFQVAALCWPSCCNSVTANALICGDGATSLRRHR